MKKANILITFMLVFLLSLSLTVASPKGDILKERLNAVEFTPLTQYEKGDLVLYDGALYELKKDHTSSKFIKPHADKSKYKEVKIKNKEKKAKKIKKFKDKTLYTDEVAVTGHNLTGSEIFVHGDKLVGLANYIDDNFTVNIYTGNDNVTYAIYSYHNETDPNNLVTDRSFIRTNGTYLFDVTSKDGFLTYQTEGFSTQAASLPDIYVDDDEDEVSINVDYFFDDFNEFSVSYTNPDNSQAVTLTGNQDSTNTYYTLETIDLTLQNFLTITGHQATPLPQVNLITIEACTSGSACVSDSFEVFVESTATGVFTQNVNNAVAGNPASSSFVASADITDLGGEVSTPWVVRYTEDDGNLPTMSSRPTSTGGTITSTGIISDTITGLTPETTYRFNFEYVKDSATVYSTTKYYTTSAVSSGGGSLTDAVASWSFDVDGTDDTGNGHDLTALNGIVHETTDMFLGTGAYKLDGVDDVLQITDSVIDVSADFTVVYWLHQQTHSSHDLWLTVGEANVNGLYTALVSGDSAERVTCGNSQQDWTATPNYDSWGFYVITYDSSATTFKFYENQTLEATKSSCTITTPSNYFTIGGTQQATATTTGYFDQVIAYDRILTADELSQLWNNGGGFDPFASVSVPLPTQSTDLPNLIVDIGSTESLDIQSYFNNFDSFTVEYINPDDSQTVTLTSNQASTNAYYTLENIDLTLTKAVSVTGIAQPPLVSVQTVTVEVCNAGGCIDDTFEIIVNPPVSGPLPTQDLALIDLNIEEGSFASLDVQSYFSNFDSFTVEYINPDDSQTVTLTSNQASTNTYYTLENIDLTLTNAVKVTGILATPLPAVNTVTVEVCNTDGCIDDTFGITIYEQGLVLPTQTLAIPDIEVDILGEEIIVLSTYFDDFTSFSLTYINPDTTLEETLTDGDLSANDYFSVLVTDLSLSKAVTLTGIATTPLIAVNTLVIEVCNVDGCIQGTTTVSVSENTVVQPSEYDAFFSSFGSQGSAKVRLVAGLLITFAAMLFGFFATKTVIIGLLAGLGGLIVSVAFGLISIWLLILVIFISLIPLAYKLFLGGGD